PSMLASKPVDSLNQILDRLGIPNDSFQQRYALAFVVDSTQTQVAEKFAELTADERPVKIFHSLHAARKWLNECATIEPRR
ncbi:MAG: hypothetical protein FD144_5901, partial [Rhodospirillaceae bacterium]